LLCRGLSVFRSLKTTRHILPNPHELGASPSLSHTMPHSSPIRASTRTRDFPTPYEYPRGHGTFPTPYEHPRGHRTFPNPYEHPRGHGTHTKHPRGHGTFLTHTSIHADTEPFLPHTKHPRGHGTHTKHPRGHKTLLLMGFDNFYITIL
jgi:hypothetical protein